MTIRSFARCSSTLLATAAMALSLGACGGAGEGAAGGGGFSMPPMPVETATVSQRSVIDRFEAVGSIEADQAITVVAEIDGIVVDIPFREGQPIETGGLIARIEDDQLRAEVDRAAALRAQSATTFDRVQSVVSQGAGAPQDLDDARAALQVAEANLALAKARLEKTRIVAPFAGIAGSRRVSRGSYLRAGESITELAAIDAIRVVFSAPERHLARLTRGAVVSITTSAWPGMELRGEIDVIEPVLDEATRSVRVIARAKNQELRLRPGMSANVRAVLSERADALTVPSESVFVEGTQAFVFLVNPDSTVHRVPLTLGLRLPDVVEVLEGLDVGARVVRAGHQKLFEGAKVMPIESQPAEGGAR